MIRPGLSRRTGVFNFGKMPLSSGPLVSMARGGIHRRFWYLFADGFMAIRRSNSTQQPSRRNWHGNYIHCPTCLSPFSFPSQFQRRSLFLLLFICRPISLFLDGISLFHCSLPRSGGHFSCKQPLVDHEFARALHDQKVVFMDPCSLRQEKCSRIHFQVYAAPCRD